MRFEELDARILLDASGVAHQIVTFNTTLGSFQVELFDEATPQTVANFLNYVQGGDLNNTFIHRSVNDFVIQGGGYAYNGSTLTPQQLASISHIPTDPPIVNEASRSNVRGTIAMARTNAPNSATSEWFINLDDNLFLDKTGTSAGYAVFGVVLGDGMQVVDAIAALNEYSFGGAFGEVPLRNRGASDLSSAITANQVVVVNSYSTATGSVQGTLYADQNNNGQRNAGEGGLSNWTVFVDNNNNGALDADELSTMTDASGNYTLSSIQFGTFTLRAIVQPGSIATAPTTAARTITFTSSGQTVTGQDFGIVQVLVPSLPDLIADRDTGADNTDNVTNLTALRFVIAGVVPGATVSLFDGAGATPIASIVADSTSATIDVTLTEGVHAIRAEQTLQGISSGKTAATTVTVDTTPRVIDAIPNQAKNVGEVLSLNVASTEEGNTGSVYSLLANPTGMAIDPDTGAISFTPADHHVGHQPVTVQAVDLAGNGSTVSFDVAVNGRPLLPPIDNRTVNRGTLLSFLITASDVDVLDFELLPVAGQPFPTGATITEQTDTTALFEWTPDAALAAGTFHVTVRVRDPGGLDAFQTFQVSINAPPVLPEIEDKTIDELVSLSFSVAATDVDAVTYQLLPVTGEAFPSGATINAAGQFQWTPTEAQGPNTYHVTIQATDTRGLTDERSFQVTVGEVNQAPVLAATGDRTVNRGDTLSFTAAATDNDLPANTLAFSLDSGAPEGASVDEESGLFNWTPAAGQSAGEYSITLRVSDGTTSHARTFQVTVNDPPSMAEVAAQTADELTPMSFAASADDEDAVTYSLEPVAGQAFPTGATIDAATGLFQWTPTEAQGEGMYHVAVKATDTGGLSDSRTMEIAVREVNEPPVLPALEDQSVNQGDAINFTVVADDPDMPTQSLFYGLGPDAPTGATIDPQSGQFSWLVSDAQSAGTFNVTILVSDDGGQTFAASQTFQVEVNASTIGFALFGTTPINGAATSAGLLGGPLAVRDAALAALAGGPFFPGLSTSSGFQSFSDVNSNNGRLESGIDNSQVGPDTGVPHALEELLKELENRTGDAEQTSGEEGKGDEVKPAVNLEPTGVDTGSDGAKKDAAQDGAAKNGEDGGDPGIRVSRRRGKQSNGSGGADSPQQPTEQGQPSPDSQGGLPSQGAMPIQRAMLSRRAASGEHAVTISTDDHERRFVKAAFFMPLLVSQLPKENQAKRSLKRKQRSSQR